MIATIEERVAHLESLVGVVRKDSQTIVSGRSKKAIGIVQREVARAFGISVETMLEPSRRQEVVWPRQVAMSIAYGLDLAGSKVVGFAFGNREHGTVLHACRAVGKRSETEPATSKMIDDLETLIADKIANENAK